MTKPTPDKRPTIDSEGRRQLGARLTPQMTQAELAKHLGVTPQAVSGWVTGSSTPGLRQATAIEALTGIPAGAWVSDEERTKIEAMAPGKTEASE